MTTDGKLSLEGVERVPYRLPELLQGIKDSKQVLLMRLDFMSQERQLVISQET